MKVFFEVILLLVACISAYFGYLEMSQHEPTPQNVATPNKDQSLRPMDLSKVSAPLKKVQKLKPTARYSIKDREIINLINAKFATGDFLGALNIAELSAMEAGHSDEFQKWLLAQMPPIMTSAGWIQLKLGKCDEAMELFQRSMNRANTSEARKGMAICSYKLRQFDLASEHMGKYLAKNPNDHDMLLVYSDLLESSGNFEEAVNVLTQLSDAVKSKEWEEPPGDLDKRLQSMKGRKKESILQDFERSLHFEIHYRSDAHQFIVGEVLQVLEDALEEYINKYEFLAPRTPFQVILYSEDGFQESMSGAPIWAEGIFDGRLRIPVAKDSVVIEADNTTISERLKIVLRHELVHALFSIKSDSRALPSWLDEGIAQYISCKSLVCEGFEFTATPGHLLELNEFDKPFIQFESLKARRAYNQSIYLMYILEAQSGEQFVSKIVRYVATSNALDSNSILKNLNTNFSEVYKIAKAKWDKHELPTR